jgi:ADP-heptose:LPS heptosyltransferase
MLVKLEERNISFGSSTPQLCFKYTLTDLNDQSAPPVYIYQRFVFNLNWTPEDFKEILVSTNCNCIHEFDFNEAAAVIFSKSKDFFFSQTFQFKKGPSLSLPKEYMIFFPGASAGSKRWPTKAFQTLGSALFSRTKVTILIAGSVADQDLAKEILARAPSPNVFLDYCGKTSLPELIQLLSGARLLVSNDTSAAHMAALLGIPTVSVCNGNKYGRFFPYPNRFENVLSIHD